MNRLFFTSSAFILCLLTAFTARAQRESIQKAIDKIESAKNVRYTVLETGNDPFGGSDYKNTSKVALYNRQRDGSYERFVLQRGKNFKYLDNGKQHLELNFLDSTYVITPTHKVDTANGSVAFIIRAIKEEFKTGTKTSLLADTTINGEACYHIFLKRPDNTDKNYSYSSVFISKNRNLIMAYYSYVQGEMFKGGLSLGLIRMAQTYTLSNYRLDNKRPPVIDLTVPAGLNPEGKPLDLLSKGTPAPNWVLTATDGKKLSFADLKGKVVFIDFCSNGCPAAALAVPSMKMLTGKYDGTDVVVLTINTRDSRDEVLKFMDKKEIKAPVYLNGKLTAKAYNVAGDPNFYLIDKQGLVNWGSRGYFEDFDNIIVKKIEELR